MVLPPWYMFKTHGLVMLLYGNTSWVCYTQWYMLGMIIIIVYHGIKESRCTCQSNQRTADNNTIIWENMIWMFWSKINKNANACKSWGITSPSRLKAEIMWDDDNQWFRADHLFISPAKPAGLSREALAHTHQCFTVSPCVRLEDEVTRTCKAVQINSDQYSSIIDIDESEGYIRRCYGRRPIAAHVDDVTRRVLATSGGKETLNAFLFPTSHRKCVIVMRTTTTMKRHQHFY